MQDTNANSQIQSLASALIASSFDRDSKVKETIYHSLSHFGKNQPELVLNVIHVFLLKHTKIDHNHRILLLKCMDYIVKHSIKNVTTETAKKLVVLASEDLTKSKKLIEEWQGAASDFLVTLGAKFVVEVMEEMQKKFVPGILPHFYVIQTLGNLAVANASGMMNYISNLLATTLPLLGLAKADNLRIVFSSSLASFCEAILEHRSNPDTEDITEANFNNEISGAYDILFFTWLQTRSNKVLRAVVQALGKTSLLLTKEKIEECAPRLVMAFVALYKKHQPDPLFISSALCNVVTAVTKIKSIVLEDNLDNLITTLHFQVSNTPENAPQHLIKNYQEVLRCFGLLASCYSEILVGVILQRAEAKDEKVKAGNLVIMQHLINANTSAMVNIQDMIVTGFLKHLFDSSNKVKYCLAKLIVAMGTHGFLLREGGKEYVHFVIQQCALVCKSQSINEKTNNTISNNQLQEMCNDILKLLTTTVEDMDKILWPYLFEFVLTPSLVNAFGIICNSLSILAAKKRRESSSDYMIDFSHFVNIPQPVALFSRFITMLAHPHRPRAYAKEILVFLQNFSGNIHKKIVSLWNEEILLILKYLEEQTETWEQNKWEALLMEFIFKTLHVVDDEEWTCQLGQTMTSQWPLYELTPEYKNFTFKCLGIVLKSTNNKEFIESYLSTTLLSIHFENALEREGVAVCWGHCASTHLDATLAKLDEFIKINITKKESSYLSIFKSGKSLTDLENLKGTVALCAGYISIHAPVTLITSRIEVNIVKIIRSLFKGVKDTSIKIDLVTAITLVGNCLDPGRYKNISNLPRYVFAAREDLISKLLTYLKDDGTMKLTKLKAAIFQALTSLVKLDPPMNDMDSSVMIKECLAHVISIVPSDSEEISASHGRTIPVSELQSQCTQNLYKLLQEVMRKGSNSNGFLGIFKQLEGYLTSEKKSERKKAVQTTGSLLLIFYEDLIISKINSKLSNLGYLLARLLPCCCDTAPELRMEAIMCVRLLLRIQNKYNGLTEEQNNDGLQVLESITEKLLMDDTQTMYEGITELTRVVCLKLPSDLTHFSPGSFTTCLFDALVWSQITSANGACLALCHIFETRGSIFVNKVEDIVSCLLGKLAYLSVDIKYSYTKEGVLRLLCLLAGHHLHSTLNALLYIPLPYTEVVSSCWTALGVNKLHDSVIEFLLNNLDKTLPYDELSKKKGRKVPLGNKTATKSSLRMSCAFHELLKLATHLHVPKEGQAMESIAYRMVAVALMRLGAMFGVNSPHSVGIDPYRQAVDLLKTVILCCCCRKVNVHMVQSNAWEALESRDSFSTYTSAIGCLVTALCKHQPKDVSHIVSCLNNYLPSIYDMQRATVVCFFAQLVKEPSGRDDVLLEIVINSLRSRLVDSHEFVRQSCIRGLANIVYSSSEQIDRFSASVLSAMLAGMDDSDDPDNCITLEAMSGLATFLNKVERTNIHSIFVNICLRIRPSFEKDNPYVRAAAFELFGVLSQFGIDDSAASFQEQVHSNFVSILLHLNDDNICVKNACKKTLRELGFRIGSINLNETFQKVLLDEAKLHYGEFMNNLSKILVVEFPDKINFYVMACVSFFQSQWPTIKSNAAIFTGFLMHNLPGENRQSINKEHVCAALILLLKDPTPKVREKAAEAISLLYQY